MQKALTAAVAVFALGVAGCATFPMPHTNSPWLSYDDNTKYSIEEKPDGFRLTVFYTHYEFVRSTFGQPCQWALTRIAREFAEKRGKKIQQPSPQNIRFLNDYNGMSGISSCSGEADIEWLVPVDTSRTVATASYSDVDKPQYQTPENSDNFAVVIGVEKYGSLPSAQFAVRDAEAVRAHLVALGYPMRNIFFLSDQEATRAKIAQSVNTWLPNRVSENSTVFFYYSGHGAPDPQTNQAYLVPIDGDAEDLDSTAFPIKLLYSKLGRLKSRQVIVALDSCFSGAGGRSVVAKGTRPLVSKMDMGEVPDNVVALTASDKSQISGTMDEQGHGAFTYYLLKGLDGAANNSAGAVTVQSLYNYLTPKVQDAARLHNRDQTPQLLPDNSKMVEIRLR